MKKLLEAFYEKELQKYSQEKFRIEKIIKRKGNKLLEKSLNGKDMAIHLILRLIKEHCIKGVNTFLSHLKILEEI